MKRSISDMLELDSQTASRDEQRCLLLSLLLSLVLLLVLLVRILLIPKKS